MPRSILKYWTPDYEASDEMLESADIAREKGNVAQMTTFAHKSLAANLNQIDAYLLLAEIAPSLAEKRALLREAYRVGHKMRHEDVVSGDHDGRPWGLLDNRPYMRAVYNLALALRPSLDAGERQEAIDLMNYLVGHNRNDNQGARYCLMQWHGADEDWQRLSAIVRLYQDDASAETAYWKALLSNIDTFDVDEAYSNAIKVNPHAADFILAARGPHFDEDSIIVGTPNEGRYVASVSFDAWRKVPGALDRLEQETKQKALGHSSHASLRPTKRR